MSDSIIKGPGKFYVQYEEKTQQQEILNKFDPDPNISKSDVDSHKPDVVSQNRTKEAFSKGLISTGAKWHGAAFISSIVALVTLPVSLPLAIIGVLMMFKSTAIVTENLRHEEKKLIKELDRSLTFTEIEGVFKQELKKDKGSMVLFGVGAFIAFPYVFSGYAMLKAKEEYSRTS